MNCAEPPLLNFWMTCPNIIKDLLMLPPSRNLNREHFISQGERICLVQETLSSSCATYILGLYRISGNRIISGQIMPKTGYPGIRFPDNRKSGYRLPSIRPDTGYRIPVTDMELVLELRPETN